MHETILRAVDGEFTIRIKTRKAVLVESKEPTMANEAATTPAPVKKAAAPVKKLKHYAFVTVDKNNYPKVVSALANEQGATIVSVTANLQVMNSYDVHYFTIS